MQSTLVSVANAWALLLPQSISPAASIDFEPAVREMALPGDADVLDN